MKVIGDSKTLGWIAQLVKVLSPYIKVFGFILRQSTYKN